ncbi:hypothetical protein [Flavobacterium selenitireducens]|uniref:hypothetical protein n=1 Tax=Flavobacterium selenitireducens TaxID=2722704 RepID=UPI00168B2359|nr:hypothetical protein [Flavobacterium selenitireducens]MBD3581230.1 hypothetical protein [Flavobacterium selenitireducens]
MENSLQIRYAAYLRATGELSSKIAFASFLLGSLLFVLFKMDTFDDDGYLLACGFIYVLLAAMLNMLVLLNLMILFLSEPNNREYFAIKILIVLANIPVVIFYLNNLDG